MFDGSEDAMRMFAWMSHANCVKNPKMQQELQGFSGASVSKEALRLCETCPVRTDCLEHAYRHNLEYGYFGGLSPSRRRELGSAKDAIQWLEQQGRMPPQKRDGR